MRGPRRSYRPQALHIHIAQEVRVKTLKGIQEAATMLPIVANW